MKRIMLIAFLLGSFGCATSQVPLGQAPLFAQPDDAVIALVVNADTYVMLVELCRQDDPTQCSTAGDFPDEDNLVLLKVKAGKHCLRRIHSQLSSYNADHFFNTQNRCIDAQPGTITYPGHLIFQKKPSQTGGSLSAIRIGFVRNTSDYQRQLSARYKKTGSN